MTSPDPAPLTPPPLDHPQVNEALARVADLDAVPLEQHHERLAGVHEVLHEVLHPAAPPAG